MGGGSELELMWRQKQEAVLLQSVSQSEHDPIWMSRLYLQQKAALNLKPPLAFPWLRLAQRLLHLCWEELQRGSAWGFLCRLLVSWNFVLLEPYLAWLWSLYEDDPSSVSGTEGGSCPRWKVKESLWVQLKQLGF